MRSRRFRSGFGVPSVAALMAEVDIVPQLSLPRREESNFLSKLLRAPCIPKQGDMQSVPKTPAPLLAQIHNPANPLWFGHRDPFRHQKRRLLDVQVGLQQAFDQFRPSLEGSKPQTSIVFGRTSGSIWSRFPDANAAIRDVLPIFLKDHADRSSECCWTIWENSSTNHRSVEAPKSPPFQS